MYFFSGMSRTIIFSIGLIVLVIGFLCWLLFFSGSALEPFGRDKIWAHRVNQLAKYKEAIKQFPGIELDIVYKPGEDIFDVTHPPALSNNLNLEMYYLKGYHHEYNIKYWLDFKNLNHENAGDALNRLTYLTREYLLSPDNIIVESNEPENLAGFKHEKFKISYYLPQKLSTMEEVELEKRIKDIRDKFHPGIDYISTDFRDYDIINKYFPRHQKLIWFTGYRHMNRVRARLLLYKILRDEKVDVLLMPFNP